MADHADQRICSINNLHYSLWQICFNYLPFGITSAPEHFQCRMSDILQGLESVVCLMDDILVYGKSQEEQDKHLTAVLHKVAAARITLNLEKCEFSCKEVKILDQLIDKQDICADPNKLFNR